MSRLSVQSADEWVPIKRPWCIGVLDSTTAQATAAFGWVWDEVEEEGLGPTFYVLLARDRKSRFMLSASGVRSSSALLALSERGVWFARWDPPHSAGDRPSTATLRPFDA